MSDAIGIDVGGTHARAALVSPDGAVSHYARVRVGDKSPTAVLATVEALVRPLLERGGRTVGVGVAGMVHDGMVLSSPNLGWRDVAFEQSLTSALETKVRMVNDLSAAAWGEFRVGASRGATDALTVFMGTGIGGAIIASGHPLRGARGVAGEFGHVKVVRHNGRRCGCGGTGCLEAYAGGANLAVWLAEVGLDVSVADLEAQATSDNAKARDIYEFVADALGMAIANQVTVLNPAVVVLGGGVLMRWPLLLARLKREIPALAVEPARVGLTVVEVALGDASGVVGAALIGANDD